MSDLRELRQLREEDTKLKRLVEDLSLDQHLLQGRPRARRELAGSRVRDGYRRLMMLLKREGWEVNTKRIYRLYAEDGLIVRTKKRKERA